MTDHELIEKLAQALRLTQEYVGDELLPNLPGWSHYDALEAYNEYKADALDYENNQRLNKLCGEHGYAYQVFPTASFNENGRYVVWVYKMRQRGGPDIAAYNFHNACEQVEQKTQESKVPTPR